MRNDLGILREEAAIAPPRWKVAGWSRPPANGRELKMLREGKEEPGIVTPCRYCGYRKFTLVRLKIKDKEKLSRSCDRCRYRRRAAAAKRYLARHRERVNAKRRADVKIKVSKWKWAQTHRDTVNAAARRYREKNREKINARLRAKRKEQADDRARALAAVREKCGRAEGDVAPEAPKS